MRYVSAILLLLIILTACNNNPQIAQKRYNASFSKSPIENKFIQQVPQYTVRISNKEKKNNIVSRKAYFFKTKKPVRVNSQGKWFHKFLILEINFENYQRSVKYINSVIKQYYNEKEKTICVDKLWGPRYYFVHDNTVIFFSSGFFSPKDLPGFLNYFYKG